MIIGIPKEIKNEEYRVAATPGSVKQLIKAGHEVLVETRAGQGSGFTDHEYVSSGASIASTAEEVYAQADLIYCVKEPTVSELPLVRKGQILFAFLHLAASKDLTEELVRRDVTSIAFETVQTPDGSLPLLRPMSEIAGRVSIQVASQYLGKMHGGSGKLLGGVPGVLPATIVIVGCGTVGMNAAQMALGLGARVMMIDKDVDRLRYASEVLHGRFETLISNEPNIASAVKDADVVIGAVLVPGRRAPTIVTEDMVKTMNPGSVIVDVAVDQGGCVETTVPTTHDNPIRIVHDVLHYGVTNIPGIVPRTSTIALSNATLPYALKLADMGCEEALRRDTALRKGLNVFRGKVTNQFVAESLDLPYTPLEEIVE